MLRSIAIASLLLALTATAAPAATCDGPHPTVGTVAVKGVTSDSGLNHYQLAGTVTNAGSAAQPKDTLQFVDIYENGVKMDAKGIPPLSPGQSYDFTYVYNRSKDAGNGTTKLTFKLDLQQPASANCSEDGDANVVNF